MIHKNKWIFLLFCFSCLSHSQIPSNSSQFNIYSHKIADYHYLIAEISSLEGKTHTAIDHFNSILQTFPQTDSVNIIYFRLAQEYLKQGLIDQAQTECEKFILKNHIKKAQIKGYFLLASIYMSTSQLKPALKQYQKILKIDQHNKEALLQYGLLLEELKYPIAPALLKKLELKTEFHQYRGDLYLSQGNEWQAIHAFKKALQLEPSNRTAALRLFQIYGYKNQYSQLTDFMEKSDFQDTYIVSLMAKAYFRQGRPKKMLEKMENLLLNQPHHL